MTTEKIYSQVLAILATMKEDEAVQYWDAMNSKQHLDGKFLRSTNIFTGETGTLLCALKCDLEEDLQAEQAKKNGWNSGGWNSGNRNSGDFNSGDRNSGNFNSGNGNSGNRNSGGFNRGDFNSGNRNSGGFNSGDWNSGNGNSGDWNSGGWNSGNRNSGGWNSGDRNSGNRNSGGFNSGNRNSGGFNSGNRNSGDFNSGNFNSGNWNSTNFSSGFFNSVEQPLYVFNRPLEMSRECFLNSKGLLVLREHFENNWWTYSQDMTDEEKSNHPEHITTGGYLRTVDIKTACKIMWDNLNSDEKQAVKEIPNFDAKVFEEITGIDVESDN